MCKPQRRRFKRTPWERPSIHKHSLKQLAGLLAEMIFAHVRHDISTTGIFNNDFRDETQGVFLTGSFSMLNTLSLGSFIAVIQSEVSQHGIVSENMSQWTPPINVDTKNIKKQLQVVLTVSRTQPNLYF